MFCNKSILVYFLAVLAVVFMMLYAWRRIYGLNCVVQILEKKLSNVQKENKELRGVLNEEKAPVNANEAEIIMNKIFDDKCCIGAVCNSKKKPKQSAGATQIKIDNMPQDREMFTDIESIVVTNISDPADIVTMITSEQQTDLRDLTEFTDLADLADLTDLPTTADNIPDHESIISELTDLTPGVYNRKKLSKMNLDKLKDLCVSMNLPTDGTKNALIDRIMAL